MCNLIDFSQDRIKDLHAPVRECQASSLLYDSWFEASARDGDRLGDAAAARGHNQAHTAPLVDVRRLECHRVCPRLGEMNALWKLARSTLATSLAS